MIVSIQEYLCSTRQLHVLVDVGKCGGKHSCMGSWDSGDRRRVLVPQALGADEFLRVTWHDGRGVMVFSHWRGAECVAATPVRTSDLGELVSLTVDAYVAGDEQSATWPAPRADELVVPAAGLSVPSLRRSA